MHGDILKQQWCLAFKMITTSKAYCHDLDFFKRHTYLCNDVTYYIKCLMHLQTVKIMMMISQSFGPSNRHGSGQEWAELEMNGVHL